MQSLLISDAPTLFSVVASLDEQAKDDLNLHFSTLQDAEHWLRPRSQHSDMPYAAFALRHHAELAGYIEAHLYFNGLAAGEVNLSYLVFPAYRRLGLATTGVEWVCNWLAATSYQAAVIRTRFDNTSSQRVAQKAGFQYEGDSYDLDGIPLHCYKKQL